MSKRLVVGVDTVWDVELKLNDPTLDPAPTCGDTSSKRGREEGEPSVEHRAHRYVALLADVEVENLIRRHRRQHRACTMRKLVVGLPRGAAVFEKG